MDSFRFPAAGAGTTTTSSHEGGGTLLNSLLPHSPLPPSPTRTSPPLRASQGVKRPSALSDDALDESPLPTSWHSANGHHHGHSQSLDPIAEHYPAFYHDRPTKRFKASTGVEPAFASLSLTAQPATQQQQQAGQYLDPSSAYPSPPLLTGQPPNGTGLPVTPPLQQGSFAPAGLVPPGAPGGPAGASVSPRSPPSTGGFRTGGSGSGAAAAAAAEYAGWSGTLQGQGGIQSVELAPPPPPPSPEFGRAVPLRNGGIGDDGGLGHGRQQQDLDIPGLGAALGRRLTPPFLPSAGGVSAPSGAGALTSTTGRRGRGKRRKSGQQEEDAHMHGSSSYDRSPWVTVIDSLDSSSSSSSDDDGSGPSGSASDIEDTSPSRSSSQERLIKSLSRSFRSSSGGVPVIRRRRSKSADSLPRLLDPQLEKLLEMERKREGGQVVLYRPVMRRREESALGLGAGKEEKVKQQQQQLHQMSKAGTQQVPPPEQAEMMREQDVEMDEDRMVMD